MLSLALQELFSISSHLAAVSLVSFLRSGRRDDGINQLLQLEAQGLALGGRALSQGHDAVVNEHPDGGVHSGRPLTGGHKISVDLILEMRSHLSQD